MGRESIVLMSCWTRLVHMQSSSLAAKTSVNALIAGVAGSFPAPCGPLLVQLVNDLPAVAGGLGVLASGSGMLQDLGSVKCLETI